jgi:hypothetical protein
MHFGKGFNIILPLYSVFSLIQYFHLCVYVFSACHFKLCCVFVISVVRLLCLVSIFWC